MNHYKKSNLRRHFNESILQIMNKVSDIKLNLRRHFIVSTYYEPSFQKSEEQLSSWSIKQGISSGEVRQRKYVGAD